MPLCLLPLQKSTDGQFAEYGEPFSTGDSIACMLDLDARTISFARNGAPLGTAYTLPHTGPGAPALQEAQPRDGDSIAPAWDQGGSAAPKVPQYGALFPHVLLKNMRVEVLLSRDDGLQPMLGCLPWGDAQHHGCACWGPGCWQSGEAGGRKEVLMLVGLPGSGKSTWARKWAQVHPEKRYVILGTDPILDQMKVMHRRTERHSGRT